MEVLATSTDMLDGQEQRHKGVRLNTGKKRPDRPLERRS
jgi:hypothetical protein